MEMVEFLGMTLVDCPGLTCIYEGWQYHSLVDFQLSVKPDSIPPPHICAKSAICYTGFRCFGSYLIINVPCSSESASQKGEFINNLPFCPFKVMVDLLYDFPGTGWCTISVFLL